MKFFPEVELGKASGSVRQDSHCVPKFAPICAEVRLG